MHAKLEIYSKQLHHITLDCVFIHYTVCMCIDAAVVYVLCLCMYSLLCFLSVSSDSDSTE